jgi:hypothetical protein
MQDEGAESTVGKQPLECYRFGFSAAKKDEGDELRVPTERTTR